MTADSGGAMRQARAGAGGAEIGRGRHGRKQAYDR
jgi:hypothetical protein